MSIAALWSDTAHRLRATAAPPRRHAGTVAGSLALLVVAASAVVVISLGATAAASAWSGGAAAVAAFVFGRLADGPRPLRPIAVGVVLAIAGAAGALAGLGSAAAALVAAGAGVALPGALTVAAIGIPVATTWTPRYRLPLRLPVSVRGRPALRCAVAVATGAGGLLALATPVGAAMGAGAASLVLAAGATLLVVVAAHVIRVARPTFEAETAAGVIAAGALAAGILWVVAGVAPPAVAAPAIALATGAAFALAPVALRVNRPRRRVPRLARPGSRGYRRATSGYEVNHRLRPAAAAVARSADDVASLVREARMRGLEVRTHSTGHRASIAAPMPHAALVRVLIDEPVTVDASRGTARIPAGAKWGDVLEAIAPAGFGAPHGSSADVGAIGYLLRGGLSFYGRGRGVAANSVLSIELVTADGEQVTVDSQRDPELFWALRGSGIGLGVVTAVTIRLFPLDEVATGMVVFDVAHAADLARAWRDWSLHAPAGITTSLRIVTVPKLPGVPRAIAGRRVVVVDGVAHRLESDDTDPAVAAAGMLDALSPVCDPLFDSWRLASPHEAAYTHMDLAFGLRHAADHLLLRRPSDDALSEFADAATGSDLMCELRQLGGALAHEPLDGGAVGLFDGEFAYFAAVFATLDDARRDEFTRLRRPLEGADTGRVVPTFAGNVTASPEPFGPDRAARVRRVQERVDPDGLFGGDAA